MSENGEINPKSFYNRYRLYSPSKLTNAYKAVKDQGMAVRAAARLYSIPLTTLRDRVDNRVSIDVTKSGPDPLLSQLEEGRLVEHLKYMSDLGYGYTRSQVMELGTDLALHLGKREINEPQLSRFWFSNFMKRWPELHVIKPRGLAAIRAKCASPQKISSYYTELNKILEKYNLKDKPHAIYNIDEKGLPTEHKPPDTVARKDGQCQAITSPRDKTTTIIGAGNAVGHQVPPFYIFAGKRKADHLIEGGLPGTGFAVTDSGWSNAEVFEEYMKSHFSKYANANDGEYLLVLYDGHASHVTLSLIDWAKERRIVLFLLPPHTSHVLQPLDIGCFGPLQRIYDKECSCFLRKNPGQIVCRMNICKISSKAYSLALSPENLRSSFRRAGIYPFNCDAIPSNLLKPAAIFTENQEPQNEPETDVQNPEKEMATNLQDDETQEETTSKITDLISQTAEEPCTIAESTNSACTSSSPFFEKRELKTLNGNGKKFKKQRRNLNSLISGQAITENDVYQKIVNYKNTQKAKSSKKGKRPLEAIKETQNNKRPRNVTVDAERSPQPGPSRIHVYVSDSELSDDISDDGELCCFCKKTSPPGLKDCFDLVIVKWAQCDVCQHWTHLRFCTAERVIRLNQSFKCPCCKDK